MAEIKTDRNACERSIKIQRRAFDVLFITSATWHHLNSPSTIQQPQLNRNDSHTSASSEPLIKD